MKLNISRAELDNGILTIKAVAESIRDLKQVPAGTLYAVLMGKLSLESFEKIISLLINAGLVHRDDSHLLHWIEPSKTNRNSRTQDQPA